MTREFGDADIEKAVKGFRPRQSDESNVFRVKELMRDLRDDALTVITPSKDQNQAQRLKQQLSAAKYIPPEQW